MDGGDTRGTRLPPNVDKRRRRIRNWAILLALLAFAGFVYVIAIVRMIEQHTPPHFM